MADDLRVAAQRAGIAAAALTMENLVAQRDQARDAAVALEQECAVLDGTLRLLTHEFDPDPRHPGDCLFCARRADVYQHRTPRWLRERHGLGA